MDEPKRKLEEASKIYGLKDKTRLLTDYEKAVNTASFSLVQSDPTLIGARDKLFQMARAKVREDGFCFKKGASRSKLANVDGDDLPKKQPKICSDDRRSRLDQIEKTQSELEQSIKIKEQRRDKAGRIKDFTLCDTLSTEIRALLKEKHILENEKRILTRKESQANWYAKKKSQSNSRIGKKSGKSATSTSSPTLESLWSSHPATNIEVVNTETDEDPNVNDIEITPSKDVEQNNGKVNELSTKSSEEQDF